MSYSKLSESDLWAEQAAYYKEAGVEAWNGRVPFQITSNSAIADGYAHLLFRLIVQTRAQRNGAALRVIELGAGSGRFSFLLLRRLDRLVEEFGSPGDDFVYVMSDLAESNVIFWEGHPALKAFAGKGRLDFAVWDAHGEEEIFLRLAKASLTAGSIKGPLAVIANYVLDSMKHDLFVREGGRSYEVLARKRVEIPKEPRNERLFTLEELSPELERREIGTRPCYQNCVLNASLEATLASQGTVMFPVGGLTALERLRALAGELFVLVADKGHSNSVTSWAPGETAFGLHGGSFSCALNFSVLEQYALHLGGSFACRATKKLIYAVFSTGLMLQQCKDLALEVKRYLGAASPNIVLGLNDHLAATKPMAKLEALFSLLELSRWDPDAFHLFRDALCANLTNGADLVVQGIIDNIPEIAAQIYDQPGSHDTAFDIGMFLQRAKRYEEALRYYELSIQRASDRDYALYNAGLCHYGLDHAAEAESCFQRALTINPRHIKARGWIAQIACDREAALQQHEAGLPENSSRNVHDMSRHLLSDGSAAALFPPAYGIDSIDLRSRQRGSQEVREA